RRGAARGEPLKQRLRLRAPPDRRAAAALRLDDQPDGAPEGELALDAEQPARKPSRRTASRLTPEVVRLDVPGDGEYLVAEERERCRREQHGQNHHEPTPG